MPSSPNQVISSLKNSLGAGEVAQQLKALTVLPVDLSLFLSTHTGRFTTAFNVSSRGFNVLLYPLWGPLFIQQILTKTHIHK